MKNAAKKSATSKISQEELKQALKREVDKQLEKDLQEAKRNTQQNARNEASKNTKTISKISDFSLWKFPSWKGWIVILLFCLFVFTSFYNLGTAPLENWDEAWYGENIQQMVEKKEPFVLYFNQNIFWEKPPLYMWLSLPFVAIGGVNELTIRLVATLSGIAIVAIVMWVSYRKFGLVPAIFAFIVLGLNNVFIWRTRTGNLDTLPTLLIVGIFFAMISKWRFRYAALGLLFGLLYLAKLGIIMFPLLVFIIHELAFERNNILKNLKGYIVMAIIGLAVVACWLIPAYFRGGEDYVRTFLLYADKGAASFDLNNAKLDYIMFAYYSLQRRFFFVVAVGIALLVFGWKKRFNVATFLFSTLLIFQLSFSHLANNWYLVPSMPFWAMAAAYGVHFIMEKTKKIPYQNFGVLAVLAVAVLLGYRTFTVNITPMFNTFSSTREATVATFANNLGGAQDVVVRLDHLYPTTVYYSNRKVYSSPADYTAGKGSLFISRPELASSLESRKIRIVVGTKNDVTNFLNEYKLTGYKLHEPIDEEVVADFTAVN